MSSDAPSNAPRFATSRVKRKRKYYDITEGQTTESSSQKARSRATGTTVRQRPTITGPDETSGFVGLDVDLPEQVGRIFESENPFRLLPVTFDPEPDPVGRTLESENPFRLFPTTFDTGSESMDVALESENPFRLSPVTFDPEPDPVGHTLESENPFRLLPATFNSEIESMDVAFESENPFRLLPATFDSGSKPAGHTFASENPFRFLPGRFDVESNYKSADLAFKPERSSTRTGPPTMLHQETEPLITKFDANIVIDAIPDLSDTVRLSSIRPIFNGSYSSVYQAKLGNELVAVKVLKEIHGAQPETMNRKLQRERTVWARLRHPNVLPLYGTAKDHELFQPFGGFISPELIAATLVFKANVLIDDDGIPQICDFGLISIILEEGTSGMTTTSPFTGTDRYLAYELLHDHEHILPTTASDIFALGCVGLEVVISVPSSIIHL
ncbi:hypothetical protein M408DRAFT_22263 [Serendipita vermifera MAFF 305830]|uniref:Protein kinase domain-containing protein n=1 Tax=Serendipita vermifera MAFF 305830 TaxID=933852 RepID=A0A0C3B0E8_SERVB|nr:hypothetical protein M408DRAFT_22263 [Serendipita vermifera MAFF 305830]